MQSSLNQSHLRLIFDVQKFLCQLQFYVNIQSGGFMRDINSFKLTVLRLKASTMMLVLRVLNAIFRGKLI